MKNDEKRVAIINDIITGIARRSSYKFKTKSVEDIIQDLWVIILEKETILGCELDLDLIATICYNSIIDMQRYEMRRNHLNIDDLSEEDLIDPKVGETDNIDRVLVKGIVTLFPNNSKEDYWIKYWSTAARYRDYGIVGKGKVNGGYTESDVAQQLGFTGTSNRGYKRFRSQIRKTVKNYLK